MASATNGSTALAAQMQQYKQLLNVGQYQAPSCPGIELSSVLHYKMIVKLSDIPEKIVIIDKDNKETEMTRDDFAAKLGVVW